MSVPQTRKIKHLFVTGLISGIAGALSGMAQAVDAAIAALGLVRTGCSDVPDPSGMRHKQMRYEGIIDMDSDIVYWNGNNY